MYALTYLLCLSVYLLLDGCIIRRWGLEVMASTYWEALHRCFGWRKSQREHAYWVIQKAFWTVVRNEFNQQAKKAYRKEQLRHKYQRLKQRHHVLAQLIGRIGMGWDSVTNTVTGSDMTWAQAMAVSVIGLLYNLHAVDSLKFSYK